MNTPTEIKLPTAHVSLLSQLDDTQSGTVSTVAYYTLVVLVMLSLWLFHLRYPCLTLSGLKNFVDMLDDMVQTRIDRGETTNFRDSVDRLQRQINDIDHEQSTVIFRWSSVHKYLCSSVITLWNIAKCYDKARVLHVSILEAITNERRAFEYFRDNYCRNLNFEGNRRRFRDEEANDMV
ncbi:hypothetical protein K435DRAFT_857255 [Dendrothele bispora CBS 962.96]|uniref:Fungal STAND N-terminal Goodbye domain-containing protein n=1 Tax=Dendrothele bispora (strain CBS 962.96) TaxID=1314807 RepID=A0A4S8M7K7_DENBC|nr:hypothetical protein K435DRAFT_857255 [Dendrothele bispora CBS 962.96]